MPFTRGTLTYARFRVGGDAPARIDEQLLSALQASVLRPTIGVPVDVETGWTGGLHILDGDFSHEHCVYDQYLHVAMRMDSVRVPPEIKVAYRAQEERAMTRAAADADTGAEQRPLGRTAKREAKENAAIEKYGLEDREGFQLYLRNPDRYEVIYGTEARDELDNLIGRERTIAHAGSTIGEHGSAMALAKAADDKSNSETILTETELAASQNDGTETDTSESVAKSIATELNLDVHDTTKITEDLEKEEVIVNLAKPTLFDRFFKRT